MEEMNQEELEEFFESVYLIKLVFFENRIQLILQFKNGSVKRGIKRIDEDSIQNFDFENCDLKIVFLSPSIFNENNGMYYSQVKSYFIGSPGH